MFLLRNIALTAVLSWGNNHWPALDYFLSLHIPSWWNGSKHIVAQKENEKLDDSIKSMVCMEKKQCITSIANGPNRDVEWKKIIKNTNYSWLLDQPLVNKGFFPGWHCAHWWNIDCRHTYPALEVSVLHLESTYLRWFVPSLLRMFNINSY